MSQTRQPPKLTVEQEPFLLIRSAALGYATGNHEFWHSHPWAQLLYGTAGAMTLYAGNGSWIIPGGKAIVIPRKCRHTIAMWGEVAMRTLYFSPSLDAPALVSEECRVIEVTALLRELILRVIDHAALDSRVPAQERLAHVVVDELSRAEITPLSLPIPVDARAASVAQEVLASPSVELGLDALARRHGAGRRTLERIFRAETGMSFGMWQQKARLLHSVRALAEGRQVTDAALDSGYSSVSAYIAAFKRTFGYTPGRV